MFNCFVCEKNCNSGTNYIVKRGLFAKSIETMCKKCEDVIDRINPNAYNRWYTYEYTHDADYKITKHGIRFIESNLNQIKKGDLTGLPKCKNCGQKSNYVKENCLSCNNSYCPICAFEGCPHCFNNEFKNPIIELLEEKAKKMTITDIAAFIRKDREDVKWVLELMFEKELIHYNGNGRYFLLKKENKQSKNSPKIKTGIVDVKVELEKFKELLDNGLINQEDYDAKKKDLLGL